MRKLKKGNGKEARERHARAVAFCKENYGKLRSTDIVNMLVEIFDYTYHTAWTLLGQSKREKPPYSRESGKGLKAYLDKQDEEKQKAYEREMLEAELNRPKFRF